MPVFGSRFQNGDDLLLSRIQTRNNRRDADAPVSEKPFDLSRQAILGAAFAVMDLRHAVGDIVR